MPMRGLAMTGALPNFHTNAELFIVLNREKGLQKVVKRGALFNQTELPALQQFTKHEHVAEGPCQLVDNEVADLHCRIKKRTSVELLLLTDGVGDVKTYLENGA